MKLPYLTSTVHRLLFDCLPCWNETSLVDNSLKCSSFTKDWTHVQFKTVTSYVIKNKTKKNNYFTWDNRTWDERTTQCIDRTETKDGTKTAKIGQRCYISRWDDKLCTLSQVRYFEWESKIILIPQERSQLFPSTPLHTCQLSRFSRESPSFSSNLPVSRLEHQISREIPNVAFFNFFSSISLFSRNQKGK